MTPIVFCASLVPWASDTKEAEPICPSRYPFTASPARSNRISRYAATVPSSATAPQINGDSTAGTITDCTSLLRFTAPDPAATTVAPITPPINAWLELDGIVKYHVIRFHMIAPINAASTSTSPAPPANTVG